MINTLRYTDAIPNHPPDVVFEYGTYTANVPSIGGLSIDVEGGRFAEDVAFRIGLILTDSLHIGFQGSVTEFTEGRSITMEGRAPHFGSASLWLELGPGEPSGTKIDYGVTLRSANLLVVPALHLVTAQIRRNVSDFAAGYKQNVIAAIEEASHA